MGTAFLARTVGRRDYSRFAVQLEKLYDTDCSTRFRDHRLSGKGGIFRLFGVQNRAEYAHHRFGLIFKLAYNRGRRKPLLLPPRSPPMRQILEFCCIVLWLAAFCATGSAEEYLTSRREFFESRIRPVLVKHCYECHSADAKKVGGQLLLDSRAGLQRGGESGAVVESGDAESSLLLSALRYESYEMPPKGQLPDKVIADFEKWINDGAVDPRENVPNSPQITHDTEIDVEAGRQFWAFQAPRKHDVPDVERRDWPRRKMDYFILDRLEQHGISPSESASREVLVRRLSFDAVGLPPTAEQVEAFQTDNQPDAYERLVERLLASPRFGERWARPWLDLARYAEDQAHIVGNNKSLFYPNAYLYRDWVIAAFNSDVPFDRFTKLQLAADLLFPEAEHDQVALGFLGLGPKYYRRNAPEVMADEWEDRVDTVTRGLLGLTVACARCHDHKYDPIPTEDYYGLAGVFASTRMFNKPLDPDADPNKDAKEPSRSMHVVRDNDSPADIEVHIRGDAFKKGSKVPRRFLQVLSPSPVSLGEGSGRASLAEAIACNENPLTARVIVNRVWAQYFGRGLVSTPSNFGKLGERPTHPELLDDLAVRFMDAGWSLKWLHREILLSATYRQASTPSAAAAERDPVNQLLGWMPQRRLSLEQWRDAMLFATGELEDPVGGSSAAVSDPSNTRRSVYSKVSRLELDSMMQRFDFPDPNAHAAQRSETTTPLQKLFLLNSPFVIERAEKLLARLKRESPDSNTVERVQRIYELLLARSPSDEELALAESYLDSEQRWQSYAQAMLATNEMTFLD